MTPFRALARLALVLLCAALSARAVGTFDESPVFTFDTRDSNSTHYGESNVFAFNTRAIDGLSGGRASGGFVLDTRIPTATGLTVNAPANFSGGASIILSATATFSNGLTEDVSDRAAWKVTGGPAGTRMNGRTLHAGYSASPVTAYVQASYLRYDRQIASPPRAVVIGPALNVALRAVPPVGFGGVGPISWTLHATATVTGGVAPFTTQWRWRGNTIAGQNGLSLAAPVGGPLGAGQLDVTVTDGQGKLGNAFTFLALNKPPVPTQPLQTITTREKEPGTLFHSDGVTGVNLLAGRKDAGLLVIVHGLTDRVELPDPANPCGAWMLRMAQSIETKLTGTAHGPPNVLLYDWNESANPSKYLGEDARNQAAKDFYAELGDRRSWLVGPSYALTDTIVDDSLTKVEQKVVDIRYVREIADRHGEALADWIETQISTLKISANAPIHLVGHSAGGFVVAKCAGRLLQKHSMPNLLVTTLDTPMFHKKHITGVKDHGARIERYNSMIGGINPALTFIKDRRTYLRSIFDNPQPRSVSVLSYTTPIVIPDPGYRIGEATSTDTCPTTDTFAMHSEAHEWYIASVPKAEQWRDGFYFSPFLGNTWTSEGGSVQAAPPLALAGGAAPPPPDQSLGGFQTFGQVVQSAGEYTLTEVDDAGIFQTLAVPIGATDLKFRVRFDQIGDGDFLEVSFGDHAPLAVIDGLSTTAGQWLDYEVSTRAIAGKNGTLIFHLVSRGASNAVVRLDSLAFVMSDDPDGDELSNAEEATLGTDPLIFDSDGDGLSDGFEVHTAHTDPSRYDTDGDGMDDYLELAAGTNTVGSASVFSVKRFAENADGSVSLWWTGRGGSTYRVLRSGTPEFASFDVVAAVPGVAPLTTFTDATVNAAQTAGAFYRVEVADAPAYPANMNADSDGDGIPDGWELDHRLNADAAADGRADFDGDGMGNLMEFALGLDPNVNSPDGIEIIADEDGYLTLTTNRNPAATGLQFRIAVSGDLAAWYSDAAHVTVLTNTSSLLKARDNIPLGSAAKRFIRLEVRKP